MPGHRTIVGVRIAALAFVAGLLLGAPGSSQPQLGNQLPHPRLNTVAPCGGKAGSTFEVVVGGADFDEPESLVFSHPGITAQVVVPEPEKTDPKKVDPKKAEMKKGKQEPPPPPKFKVTIAPDVPIGYYDVRFAGKHGISNARTFVVGELTEVAEKEPNNDIDQAQRVDINSTINGAISQPTDVDYFVFAGKKGQRVLIQCLCASIDSRLNPQIKVLDKDNREIVSYYPAPLNDALVDLTIPGDGDYKIRLVQFAHQLGGPELFYRLSITTGPWIDAIFPPMVEPGKESQVTLYGRNLPGGRLDPNVVIRGQALEKLTVTVTPPQDLAALHRLAFTGILPPVVATQDGFEYRVKNNGLSSNPALLLFARAPVVLEQEPNDVVQSTQQVPVPCEIAGRINKRNDRDWYSFTAKKGDVFIIDLQSNRLGAPTDLYLTVRNATGKDAVDMVQLDDNADSLHPFQFLTSSKDPAPYRLTAPADGKYQLLVGSHLASNLADVQQLYRLRIVRENPDFRLFVMPADAYRPDSCRLGAGGNQDLTVLVLRQDGFQGEVELTASGLPPGVVCKPQSVGAGMKQVALVLNAAADAKPWTGSFTVKGTAKIAGAKVERDARPASITWPVQPQNNIPTITRLERSLVLGVRDKAPYSLTCGMEKAVVVHGGKLTIPLKLTRLWPTFKSQLTIQPLPGELPPGMNFPQINFPPGKDDQTVNLAVPINVPPGKYTIVFKSFAPIPVPIGPKTKDVNVVQCSSPVVVIVLPKQVATLSAAMAGPGLKVGEEAELVVKVARQNGYAGDFKVKLLLPADAKGLSADEATIPAGQNEVKLTVRADDDAAPGPRNNLTIRAIATLEGVDLAHETKINVNVIK
jgi:hypothetical protein